MFSKTDKIKSLLNNSSDPKLVERAFEFAENVYKDKKRFSGENYLEHAIRVANTLNEMGLGPTVIATALLHDVLDELLPSVKNKELKRLEDNFGKEIATLVKNHVELHKIRYALAPSAQNKTRFSNERFENIQKMLFAIAGDIRAILIELASRLDNLDTMSVFNASKQKIYALETIKIFAPIADQLGMWELKYKLEDLSFSYLFPDKLNWVHSLVKEKFNERKRYLKKFSGQLKKLLKKNGVNAIGLDFRPKSHWSAYKKLLKYNNDIEKVHDLLALRIIVSTVENCYKTLGIIHKRFRPLSEEIDDYIAKPKQNGYRSLHTTVFSEDGHITEIQIKTPEMHKEAQYGICSHWAYKEGLDLAKNKERRDFSKEVPKLWKKFKIDFYENKVFALTPKGDVVSLKKGAGAIDFAYAVHSDIGNHCESVKINGKMASLSEPLNNGDIVEIITNKKRGPSMDWLKYAKTNLAISQIKKELAKGGLSARIAALAQIPSLIKKGVIGISERIVAPKPKKKEEVLLAGQKGISIVRAKCCKPQSDDDVKAYLSKHRAAVLHKSSCKEFQKLAKQNPEKVIDASWQKG